MVTFQLSNKAKSDLMGIGRYTQKKWGREQRNKYLTQLDECFHGLAHEPFKGKECSDTRKGYRHYPSGRHTIYYRQVSSNRIEIVRVLHYRMEPERHL